ncbi:DUF4062 domain-containing protein [Dokdonia sp.]|uniref:DUF4062 domain-containing protein n=1 Tax=Dokdonia sp. TaxID=2024995 RepID=UPI0032636B8E
MKVFLAGRFKEFEEERKIIDSKFKKYNEEGNYNIQIINLDDDEAHIKGPLRRSMEAVRESSMMILLIGDTYSENIYKNDLSITHLEYQEAKENNITIIPYYIGKYDDKPFFTSNYCPEKLAQFKKEVFIQKNEKYIYKSYNINKKSRKKYCKEIIKHINKNSSKLPSITQELDTAKINLNIETVFRKGYLINDTFTTSLLEINVLKYLVFNRLNYVHIWIGSPDIFIELQELENYIQFSEKGYKTRNWEKNIEKSNSDQDSLFINIQNEDDYLCLKSRLNDLQGYNVIICFNLKSIAISKIYAAQISLSLKSKKHKIRLLTDSKVENKNKKPLKDILKILNTSSNLLSTLGIDSNNFNHFYKKDTIFYSKIEQNGLINQFLKLLFTFTEYSQKEVFIKKITASKSDIYEQIKTDLNLLEKFLNQLNTQEFTTLLQVNKRIIFLTAFNKILNLKPEFYIILKNKLPNPYPYIKYIEPNKNEDLKPTNRKEFWLLLKTNKRLIDTINSKNLNPAIKYLKSITSPFSEDELSKIIQSPDLRLAYHLVKEDDSKNAYIESSFLEENLYIYEI